MIHNHSCVRSFFSRTGRASAACMQQALAMVFLGMMLLTPSFASAYGAEGHGLTGAIADERLKANPAIASMVTELLDGITLAEAAVIPDRIKGWKYKPVGKPGAYRLLEHPEIEAQLVAFFKANLPYAPNDENPSHHWFHYTDVPVVGDEKYADGKIGRSKWDIVQIMPFCVKVLKGEINEDNDRRITRAVAVILLAHFVGDIHQPLHVGAGFFNEQGQPVNPKEASSYADDHGGNTISLKLPESRRKVKLHVFWDSDLAASAIHAMKVDAGREKNIPASKVPYHTMVRYEATHARADWQPEADLPVEQWAETWANEILPLAREAHQRLVFSDFDFRNGQAYCTATPLPRTDDQSYTAWGTHLVQTELNKAGWRLAAMLEAALTLPQGLATGR